MDSNCTRKTLENKGFALVVTLSLMVLLTLVAVGLLALNSVSLRSSSITSANALAMANARMAVIMAIGELQKRTGPDQSVTARADLLDPESPNPTWTGAWRTNAATPVPAWLVSGSNPDPANPYTDANSALLFKPLATPPDRKDLRAPLVEIKVNGVNGAFAWWVGDEGTKARVDLKTDPAATLTDAEKFTRSQSPQAPGLTNLGSAFPDEKFGVSGTVNKSLLASPGTVGLATGEPDVPKQYFDDITTGGFGLPVNVKQGGLKTDLSLVFDRSQQSKPFVAATLGGTPTPLSQGGSRYYNFGVTVKTKFYLSDELISNVASGVGPNWGILFNYARLWENAAAGTMDMVGPNPFLGTDLRQDNWAPYTADNGGTMFTWDVQHTNSSVNPVLSMTQIGFMMGAKSGPNRPAPANTKRYQPQLLIKPVIGLWNPYNVAIKPMSYQFEWAIAPYFLIDFQRPSADGSFAQNSGNTTAMWLRDYWKISPASLPTPDNPQGGSWIRLKTDPVDFQPGEFRLFSVEANPAISADFNRLVPTLDPKGAFTIDIIRSDSNGSAPEDQAGKPLLVDEGYWGWFGYVYLQDTHWNGSTAVYGKSTRQHFPSLDTKAAKTWLTTKAKPSSGDIPLNRYTNLWNGGNDEKSGPPYIPEPIMSARDRLNTSGASGKIPHRIEELASGNPAAVGTWRFYTRNSLEMDDPGQGARGWVDANPATLASNVRFDGSTRTEPNNMKGWNAAAQFIPGAHRTGAAAGDVGDGNGGNRGLVAEGGYSSGAIPQGVPTAGRWQGYLGAGSTAATGFTHVILYDVPRSPLVSVGQFQHAQLQRYNFEPGFVVGNSYANPRLPLGSVSQQDFAGITGFKIVDIAHQVNQRLWDKVFFSTLGLDYLGKGSGTFDSAFDYPNLILGKKSLLNPRMIFTPLSGDTSIDKILKDADVLAPQAIAARINISGSFNVNSTSVAAWKAILSSMGSSQLPTINPTDNTVSWQSPEGIRFNRFGSPISPTPSDGSSREAAFWQGWRKLSTDDLDDLAKEIVNQVRKRGPFLSMADFVNRNPKSATLEHQQKGALQAALDKAINNKLPDSIGKGADNPTIGASPSNAVAGENQAAGHASYLLQGDLLQSLAPVMQVRSDYFRIRAYGEARDNNGKVTARAWCEAFVQRSPHFLDPSAKPETAVADLKSPANTNFGRHYKLVGFRWLNPKEI